MDLLSSQCHVIAIEKLDMAVGRACQVSQPHQMLTFGVDIRYQIKFLHMFGKAGSFIGRGFGLSYKYLTPASYLLFHNITGFV